MSWMAKLYETYEAGVLLDLPDEQKPMPVSHSSQYVHINIVIDGEGKFKRANVLNKKSIVLPATEQSAGRSGTKAAAHPLCDKLHYIAKDYLDFGGQKTSFFDKYVQLLTAWCESEFSHQKANAVLKYINKGMVISDLVNHKILFVDANRMLITPSSIGDVESEIEPLIFKSIPKDAKTKTFDQGSALVCWTVEIAGDSQSDTWLDKSLQQSWINFDALSGAVYGLCYVTGDYTTLASNHPSKVLKSEGGAKLISSNDTDGFTFRGRFTDSKESIKESGTQALGIGFEVTQKSHNALKWLIKRQGRENGSQAFVAWAVSGKSIPNPLQDTLHLIRDVEADRNNEDSDDFDFVKLTEEEIAVRDAQDKQVHTIDQGVDIGQSFAIQLKKYMAGYRAALNPNEQIVVMGIDAATPGRMGIIYYREPLGSEFLERLEQWHVQFAWPQRLTIDVVNNSGKKPTKKTIWPMSCPAPLAIAEAAYGHRLSAELKKSVVERLAPCIIDGAAFPVDLMNACVRSATNRSGYKSDEQWQWEKNLGIACAVYRGYFQRHPKENQRREFNMALDEKNHSRDYLYGRLLAVAERIEEIALSASGENRSTTAARLMQRFADRPYSTWRNIELALQPYMQRLKSSRAGFLVNRQKDLDAINDVFDNKAFISDKKLSGEFLLGYHCQRQKLREKTECTNDADDEK